MIWMIDTNEVFLAFKEKLDNMSIEDRKEYLKKMGFRYSVPTSKSAKRPYYSTRNRRSLSLSGRKRARLLKKYNKAV